MAFNGSEGGEFPLETASKWTANYREANPGGIKAHFFGKDLLNDILGQEGCMGIRMFYALDDNDVQQMIIVGVDEDENDLYEGIVGEISVPCPNRCGAENPLNS